MSQTVTAYKSKDGKLFFNEKDCKNHENEIEENKRKYNGIRIYYCMIAPNGNIFSKSDLNNNNFDYSDIDLFRNIVIAYDMNTKNVGVSMCNPMDQFNKKIGRTKAMGRLASANLKNPNNNDFRTSEVNFSTYINMDGIVFYDEAFVRESVIKFLEDKFSN